MPHYSINKPVYSDEDDNILFDDWLEMEQQINCAITVNDYDDLVCDPHNILE